MTISAQVRNTIEIKMDSTEIRQKIIKAGEKAVTDLIKVAEQKIVKMNPNDDLAADKLKNAAAAKKLAIFDAFEIMSRIESEQTKLDEQAGKKVDVKEKESGGGFVEKRSR